ncbi:MAG TPA: right-handed parallel beta-helix repeat-containing protein [Pyrinomonadaceae bacterium]|jgi:hypothetical protein|nr:right-handed parallel beta-helix repeat-containing protein [Pyrinomonadaceae bacterium]
MKNSQKNAPLLSARNGGLLAAFVIALAVFGAAPSSANHPVLVEGNCDSPVPGTTIVDKGTCGDFDGDGRIGTAEDTDGADRIFGTLNAALGPGTGAAAGTGANQNGRIIIVTSGRFSEPVSVSTNAMLSIQSTGHVQIEAAPGVEANIDAVYQGDPAGGNNVRQEAIGLLVSLSSGATATLRNLTIRNFAIGIRQQGSGRLLLENCRIDNNRDFGLQVLNESKVVVERSVINATGRRVGTANNTTAFGHGVQLADLATAIFNKSSILNATGACVQNNSSRGSLKFETLIVECEGGGVIGSPLINGTY